MQGAYELANARAHADAIKVEPFGKAA